MERFLPLLAGVIVGIIVCIIGLTTNSNYFSLILVAIIVGAIIGIAIRSIYNASRQEI